MVNINWYRHQLTNIRRYVSTKQQPNLKNVTIPKKTENSENLLSGVKAGQYEVVAELTPQAGTKEVGFKLRTNKSGSQETVVSYNTETKKVPSMEKNLVHIQRDSRQRTSYPMRSSRRKMEK